MLRRLSVFAGGATLEAAEAVCAGDPVDPCEILDVLGRLVEKSLVFTDPTVDRGALPAARDRPRVRPGPARRGGRGRTRRCAGIGTGTSPSSTQASPAFFHGPEPVEWLRRLDREHDDLRAALEWCLDQPGEGRSGLRIAAGLWRYWEIRGHLTEGRGWLERMVGAVGDDSLALRAERAHRRRVSLAFMQGDFEAASTLPRGEPRPPSRDRRPAEHRVRRQQPRQHRHPARRSRPGAGALRGDDRPRSRARRRARHRVRVDQPRRRRDPPGRPGRRPGAARGEPGADPPARRSLDGGVRDRHVRRGD